MNKEQTYDEKISPLMLQIIDICKANGIAMIATFALPTEENGGSCFCTTHLPDETGQMPERIQSMANTARRGTQAGSPMMITTVHGDGSKTLTAVMG